MFLPSFGLQLSLGFLSCRGLCRRLIPLWSGSRSRVCVCSPHEDWALGVVSTGYDLTAPWCSVQPNTLLPLGAFGNSISRVPLPGLRVTRSKPAFVEVWGFASNKMLCHLICFILLSQRLQCFLLRSLSALCSVSCSKRRMLTHSWGSSPRWDCAGWARIFYQKSVRAEGSLIPTLSPGPCCTVTLTLPPKESSWAFRARVLQLLCSEGRREPGCMFVF